MRSKNSIWVQNGEKELYHIFKDLEKHGRAVFSYQDYSKHNGIARNIGRRAKSLVEQNFIIPPLSSTHHSRITGIIIPIGIKVTERKTTTGSNFIFQREK